jgi:hypothetical protein
MNSPAHTLTTLSARRASRGVHSPDAMATYLDGLLAEAEQALAACARDLPPKSGWRGAIRAVAEGVRVLRADLRWLRGGTPVGEPGAGAMPAMTRAMLRDVERAALCGAFRERCAELPSRLAEPDAARAAVAELHTALTVLGRALGTLPLSA